jgi:hypothetical protein
VKWPGHRFWKLSGLNIYSHFTGSYSWILKTVVEKNIGAEAGYDELNIKPNLLQLGSGEYQAFLSRQGLSDQDKKKPLRRADI